MSVVEIVLSGAGAVIGGLLAWVGLEGQRHRCVRYSAVETAIEYLAMVGMPRCWRSSAADTPPPGVLQHLHG